MNQPNAYAGALPSHQPEGGPRQYKRKMANVLIHRPMQREFTFVLVVLFMISIMAAGFVIHYTIREAAFGGGFQFGRVNPYEVLSEVSYQLIFWVTCILFATLMVIGFFALFFLHRVAGPVYRFRQTLIRINHRNQIPPSIKLRQGDFFVEVAEEINKLLKHIQTDEAQRLELAAKLERILSEKPSPSIEQAAREALQLCQSKPHPHA